MLKIGALKRIATIYLFAYFVLLQFIWQACRPPCTGRGIRSIFSPGSNLAPIKIRNCQVKTLGYI